MLRFLTAGESHGKALVAILEGVPAGLAIDLDAITAELRRRQTGYGRGRRMAIESDRAEPLSGIRHGRSTGAPIALLIPNKDWENWQRTMHVEAAMPAEASGADRLPVTRPRPGHADLAGFVKYGHDDMRNVLERERARNGSARGGRRDRPPASPRRRDGDCQPCRVDRLRGARRSADRHFRSRA